MKKVFAQANHIIRLSAACIAAVVTLGIAPQALAERQIEAGFGPGTGRLSALRLALKGINDAEQQVLIAVHTLSNKAIALALFKAKERGVNVLVVADKLANTGDYSALNELADKGVYVRLNDRYASMQSKYIVIDGTDVALGSFGFAESSDKKTAENALILHDAPDIANDYTKNFKKLWNEAQPLAASY